jgi:hypothetical protein
MSAAQLSIAIAIEDALNGKRAVREALEAKRYAALRTGNVRLLAAAEVALAQLEAA